jgi:hypothetical protein
MTTEEIKKRIKRIRSMKKNPEIAHAADDQLRADFIEYVSTLPDKDLAAKAKLVMSTDKIGFARWYA